MIILMITGGQKYESKQFGKVWNISICYPRIQMFLIHLETILSNVSMI